MATHGYKVGDKVVVWNQTLSGKTIREGRATVLKLVDNDDTYLVRFDADQPGEPKVERHVPFDVDAAAGAL